MSEEGHKDLSCSAQLSSCLPYGRRDVEADTVVTAWVLTGGGFPLVREDWRRENPKHLSEEQMSKQSAAGRANEDSARLQGSRLEEERGAGVCA